MNTNLYAEELAKPFADPVASILSWFRMGTDTGGIRPNVHYLRKSDILSRFWDITLINDWLTNVAKGIVVIEMTYDGSYNLHFIDDESFREFEQWFFQQQHKKKLHFTLDREKCSECETWLKINVVGNFEFNRNQRGWADQYNVTVCVERDEDFAMCKMRWADHLAA